METSLFLILLLLLPADWYSMYLFFANILHIKNPYSAIFSTVITIALFVFLLHKYNKKSQKFYKNHVNSNVSSQNSRSLPAFVQKPSLEELESDRRASYLNVFYDSSNYLEGDYYYVRINISSPDFFHSIFTNSALIKRIRKNVFKHRLTKEEINLWKKKRADFEEIKNTNLFRSWKRAQFDAQKYKCAWCKRTIQPGTRVETDHIQPLYYGGENSYANYVLACHRCNQEKGKSTCGWGDNGYDGSDRKNYKPTWIKANPITGL